MIVEATSGLRRSMRAIEGQPGPAGKRIKMKKRERHKKEEILCGSEEEGEKQEGEGGGGGEKRKGRKTLK